MEFELTDGVIVSKKSGRKLRQDARKRMGKNPIIGIELSGMILVKDEQVKSLHMEPERMLQQSNNEDLVTY